MGGHMRHQALEHPVALGFGLAHRQTPDRQSLETDGLERAKEASRKFGGRPPARCRTGPGGSVR
jgi:hypothetical protein